MRDPVSLQLALHRRQRAQIAAALEAPSPAFRAYERRYRRRVRAHEAVISRPQVDAEIRCADVVYVGDYHTLRTAQDAYLELAEAALGSGRRVVLALEFVEARHQRSLDAYLGGRMSERELLADLGHVEAGFTMWSGFRPILAFARSRRLEVVGIDRRASGPRALAVRDRFAGAVIAKAAAAPDRPLVLALVGQYHVAPCHLPREVKSRLPSGRRHLVVYQNCEAIHWRLMRERRAGAQAVRVRAGELCLLNSSPVLSQQSFLDQLEAEPGDAPLAPGTATTAFRQVATLIARQLRIPTPPMLAQIEVCTVAHPDPLSVVRSRAKLSPRELDRLCRRVLHRDSAYLPRARLVYLASLTLNHAAEEAAHFVRHACIGDAMERPRALLDHFYARVLEEALGFAGSRLVNPRRRCPGLEDHARTFRTARGQQKAISAHVLAHKAAEAEQAPELESLVPLHDEATFDAVSHALGYLLGDALDRAFRARRLGPSGLRALFCDPLDRPAERYLELVREFAPGRAVRRASAR